jgi:hypothetical protein
MPPKSISPPRPPAAHVQAALLRAAQAKLPDRSPRQGPQPEHVRRALAPLQAKLPDPPSQTRPPAPHVRAAVTAVQRKATGSPARPVQAKTLQRAVLQPAKVKDLPGYKELSLSQSYTAKQYSYAASRYVMLDLGNDWHITFFPKDPASDPYQNSVLEAYVNEDATRDERWRHDYQQIGELDYNEFHVTFGKLHKGTAKHFFYDENGNFLREGGAGITDDDRKKADQLRATITPHATVNAYKPPSLMVVAESKAVSMPSTSSSSSSASSSATNSSASASSSSSSSSSASVGVPAPRPLWFQNPHVIDAMVNAPVPSSGSLKDRLKRNHGMDIG